MQPTSPTKYFTRGNKWLQSKKYKSAIQDYDQAIALDPKDVYAYFSRGHAYWQLEEHQHAIHDFDQAIALDPKYTK